MVRMEKNIFVRLVATKHVLEAMLICSSKDTTFNTADAIGANTCLSLWLFTVFFHNPSGPDWWIKWENDGHHYLSPASLKSLRVATNFCHSPTGIFFFFWCLDRSVELQRIPLDFSRMITFSSQAKEPMWRFCCLSCISILIIYLWIREMTSKLFHGLIRTTMSQTWTDSLESVSQPGLIHTLPLQQKTMNMLQVFRHQCQLESYVQKLKMPTVYN